MENANSALLQNSQHYKNTSMKEIEYSLFYKTLSGPFLHSTLLGTAGGSGDLSGVDGSWMGMRVVYSFQPRDGQLCEGCLDHEPT